MSTMQLNPLDARLRCMQELVEHIAEPLAVVSINSSLNVAELVLLSGGATKLFSAAPQTATGNGAANGNGHIVVNGNGHANGNGNGNGKAYLEDFYRLCILGSASSARRLLWQTPSGEVYRLNAITLGLSKPGPLLLVRLMREHAPIPPESDLPDLEAAAQQRGMSTCEARVFALMARGMSNKEIAQKLNISYHTTRSHLRNVFRTLNVSNRTEARVAVFG